MRQFLFFVAFFCSVSAVVAAELRGKVVAIADGDTITVLDAEKVQHKIRLIGIDAPEKKQAFGTRSRQHLGDLIHEKDVVVKWNSRDRYQRILGDVYLGERNVNLEMVRDGFAWHFKRYSKDKKLAEAEEEARAAKRGLWADKEPIAPWEYRKSMRKPDVRSYIPVNSRPMKATSISAQFDNSVEAGLVGGGSTPSPGEISLAHHGVLFLDELPEFNRRTLEVLRQPLEEGNVTISRAMGSVTFPATLMLVAALNPCPCGYRGDPRRKCNCSPMQIEKYVGKISGPLLDRIDIHVEVPAVPFRELSNQQTGTTSAEMRQRVITARTAQDKRFATDKQHRLNGRMQPRQIRQHCKLNPEGEALLKNAMDEMGLSARAHDKILRVSRTIADLEGSEQILAEHLSEAINYRTLDRNYWA